jgi:hypothetical protein
MLPAGQSGREHNSSDLTKALIRHAAESHLKHRSWQIAGEAGVRMWEADICEAQMDGRWVGLGTEDCVCNVFMPSFIVALFLIFVVIFHVFEVSLLVEVRLRASLSAPKRTPVANDAPARFSALSCFSIDNKTPKQ